MSIRTSALALGLASVANLLERLAGVFERRAQQHPEALVPKAAQALSDLIRAADQLVAAAETFEAKAEPPHQEQGQ